MLQWGELKDKKNIKKFAQYLFIDTITDIYKIYKHVEEVTYNLSHSSYD